MNIEMLLTGLAGLTFVAVLVFAVTSRRAAEQRMENDKAPKSSLAKDGDSHRRAD
ncbi:hypothetical protein ACERZ8_18510 [Tateyamaria armeniaca]|uniref:Cbb3-type cytochrome c oxidase subunit 3 n=1 Tax=Tateyamaria armeniaca TaxID=2518930 RepID=A0ABW8UXU3_9RHOB